MSGIMSPAEFQRRFRWGLVIAWIIPPATGELFMAFLGFWTFPQAGLSLVRFTGLYVFAFTMVAILVFERFMVRPLKILGSHAEAMTVPKDLLTSLKAFPWIFWGLLTLYCALGPSTVLLSNAVFEGLTYTVGDYAYSAFGVIPVLLIAAFPMFYYLTGLLGDYLAPRRVIMQVAPLWLKLAILGLFIPVLIDTILLLYYFDRTGYLKGETLALWTGLIVLAAIGTIYAIHSFRHGMRPLQEPLGKLATQGGEISAIPTPCSMDEFGMLTAAWGKLLTERKQTEEAFRARGYQQALVAQLGQRALTGADTSIMLGEAVALVARTLGVEYCKVLELLPGSEAFLLREGVGWKEGYVGHATVGAGTESQAGYTLASHEPVIVDDLRTETRFNGPLLLHDHGVRSGMSVMIHGSQRPFGVLGAHTKQLRQFTEDDTHFLQGVANVLAAAIERKRTEAALRESEEQIRLLLDSTAEAIYGLDLDGNCTFCNPACLRFLGYDDPHDLVGRNTHALIHHTRPDGRLYPREECRIYQSFREAKESHVDDEVLWRADGTSFPAEYWSYPMYRGRELVGSVVAFVDISDRKRGEAQLTQAYEQLRELNRRLEAAEEMERKRIARELHDEFGQALTCLKFDIARLGKELTQEGASVPRKEVLAKIRSMSILTDTTIQSVRRIAASLRPSLLDDLGLVAALEWQARDFQARTGVRCELAVSPQAAQIQIDADRSTALFRITQELLTNVMRHAKASKVRISLGEDRGNLILEVKDNGEGITERQLSYPRSLGLLGIRERVSLFGGTCLFQGVPQGGTTVTVRLQIKNNG